MTNLLRTFCFAACVAAFSTNVAWAADEPLTIEAIDHADVRTSVVTIGDVARISGGDPAQRYRVSRIDLAKFSATEPSIVLKRRLIEMRLKLAGIDSVHCVGVDSITTRVIRRSITQPEVLDAVRDEIVKRLGSGKPVESIEPVRPIAVQLPDVAIGDAVSISCKPHAPLTTSGKMQMDVVVSCCGEYLLAFPVLVEIKLAGQFDPIMRASATVPGESASGNQPVRPYNETARPTTVNQTQPVEAVRAAVIKPRQRVTMIVRCGAMSVSAVGEARQEGRLGQSIEVQNIDSKKIVSGRVVGPDTVEIEIGATP